MKVNQNITEWANCLRDYEKSRKLQKEQPKFEGHVKSTQKQSNFDVIQSKYQILEKEQKQIQQEQEKIQKEMHRSFNIPNKKKYYNNYDIVNLEKVRDFGNENLEKTKKFVMPSRQVDYNIVTNQLIDQNLYKNSNTKFQKEKKDGKRCYSLKQRDSNIVSNKYRKNHEEKIQANLLYFRKKKIKKPKLHVIELRKNKILIVQQQHISILKEKKNLLNKKFNKIMDKILVKSFLHHGNIGYIINQREPFILDSKKLPPELAVVDAKNLQSKKRWELRFQLENEYRERDIQSQQLKQQAAIIKYHNKDQQSRIDRGRDIINHENIDKAQTFTKFNQEPSTWNKIMVTANN